MSPRLQVPEDEPRRPEPEQPGTPAVPDAPPQLSHEEIVREQRESRVAGVIGVLAIIALFASFLTERSGLPQREGDSNDKTQLLDLGAGGGAQVAAAFLSAGSLVLAIAVAWFLYRATKNRNPHTSVWIPRVATVAFLGAAVFLVLSFFEVRDVGRFFVDLPRAEQTLDRAEALFDDARDNGDLRWINIGAFATAFLSGVWLSLASLESMRVGLLTRFLGIFGIGTGLATAISFPVAPFLFIGWLGSVAILMLGWWPGGRPPAWDEGRAVGWEEVDAREGRARRARREQGQL